MEKARQINEAKVLKEKQKDVIAKDRKIEQVKSEKKQAGKAARKVLKNLIAPALMASAYEVSDRKKRK